MATVTTLLSSLGVLVAAYLTYTTVQFIHLHFLRCDNLGRYLHTSNGQPAWTLVTGASDGIGRSLAHQLCSRGFSVLLHGRNPSKLESVQSALRSKYPDVSIDIVVGDATKALDAAETVAKYVKEKGYHVTVLINNVGGSVGTTYNLLPDMPSTKVDDLISMNLLFMTHLTRLLLPTIQQHSPSLILNIGSASAEMGIPFLSVYSAAKSFNIVFSKALSWEVASKTAKAMGEVEVMGVLVSTVATANSGLTAASFTNPTPDVMARAMLQKVGCGRRAVWGYWVHEVQCAFFKTLPETWAGSILAEMLGKRIEIERKGK